jgi:nucleoside-diphosphate-sugar epimerase
VATYLVTGAAGFIGSNIVEALVRRGATVRALDNFSTGRRANIAPFLSNVELFEGSLNDDGLVDQAVRDVDYVLHQAALPSVPRSVTDPLASHEANATGTLRLLIAARDAGVKRLVFASSSSVYGDSPQLPKREDMPTSPLSPYAVNKLAGEEYCKVFTRLYGFPAVSLRYFNVFGPRQDPKSQYAAVIPAFITAALDGKRPTVHGDGSQTRDFTYVENVVEANLLACEARDAEGQAMNVACGERISLLDLLAEIGRITGRDIDPVFDAERPGDVKHSLADISKAERLLGYQPVVSFAEGLRRTIDYFRSGREVA